MENDCAFAEILNDCLEAIETGEASIEDCLARHPQHAARLEGLLRLGDEARRMPIPTPTPEMLAAGEQRLLNAIRSKAAQKSGERVNRSSLSVLSNRLIESVKARTRSWPRWAVPALAVSGSMALLFACVFVIALGAGAAWRAFRNEGGLLERPRIIAGRSATSTPGADVTQRPMQTPAQTPSPTPESGVAQSPITAPEQTPGLGVAQSPILPPDQEKTYVVHVPFLSAPLPPDRAVLRDLQGVIEFQTDGGPWGVASEGQVVQAGQRVRTGALSGAQIAFYDGSVAHLGPDSEVSIDDLGRDATDGARIIKLTQWVGESDHDVTPAHGDNARYEVHTPSGTGTALGTSFHAWVVPGLWSRFIVDRGSVSVLNVNVTVVVVAGQLTTIPVDRPPSQPFFRVEGEGEVTQIGNTWKIAGQTFSTHDHTVIVGNPQVGDWVHVDGHLLPDGTRVADRIVLLRRSPVNRFTITGEVEAIGTATWTVAGQEIAVNETTEIDGHASDGIQIGDLVRVDGMIDEDGAFVAESIRLIWEPGIRFDFVGVVQDISDTSWRVSGVSIAVDDETVIDDALAVGDLVRVRGVFLEDEDGTWLARSIVRVVPDEHPVGAVYPFEFVSFVERIDPWRVSGIDIETRMWTEIKGPIEVGDRVKVEGWILPDGIWLADEIKLTGERDALFFEFVGRVRSIEPWIVGGIPLTVDHRTEMKGPIGVGDRVKVEGWILPDNVWLATEIKRVEEGLGRGCMQFTALVVRVDADRVVLENGATISLEDAIPIVGELKINSVIVFIICIDDEGNMIVVSILVLYQLEPAIIVHPTSAPPEPPAPEPTRRRPSPPGGGGSIVVTENNQTRTFTCNGHSVTIRGNDNAITLLGNCGPVTVRGNNNWVSIQSASSVTNTGNNNTIVGR